VPLCARQPPDPVQPPRIPGVRTVAPRLADRMTSAALLLPGGDVVVPAAMLKELLHELEQPRQQVPMGVHQPHRSRPMTALIDTVLQGAIAHNQALRESSRACAALSQTQAVAPSEASVVAGSLSIGGEVVGVAVAAVMLGKSLQWTRALAKSGRLPGARMTLSRSGNGSGPARICWCIPLASVHAYLRDRQVV
jgi:hypothetical protein